MPTEELNTRLQALGDALALPTDRAAVLAVQQPAVLLLEPREVSSRLQTIRQLLKADMGKTQQAVADKPGLLLAKPEELRAAVQQSKGK